MGLKAERLASQLVPFLHVSPLFHMVNFEANASKSFWKHPVHQWQIFISIREKYLYGLGGIRMNEFFEEIIERAHYYEQFELFREYKQTFQRNQTGKSKPEKRDRKPEK